MTEHKMTTDTLITTLNTQIQDLRTELARIEELRTRLMFATEILQAHEQQPDLTTVDLITWPEDAYDDGSFDAMLLSGYDTNGTEIARDIMGQTGARSIDSLEIFRPWQQESHPWPEDETAAEQVLIDVATVRTWVHSQITPRG